MALRIKDMPCCADGCGRSAEIRCEPGPTCNLHYQRWIYRGSFAEPKRAQVVFNCAKCGSSFERRYAMSLKRKSGAQYCSQTCELSAKALRVAQNAADRFWANVDKKDENSCWIWKKGKTKSGYGRVTFSSDKTQMAHRIAYLLHYGSHPSEKFVCHRCDTPPCCNPHHLFLGTHADNMRDMAEKGRAGESGIKGECHPFSRMDGATALQVYLSAEPDRVWAERLGVTPSAIYNIRHGKSWAHVTGAARG